MEKGSEIKIYRVAASKVPSVWPYVEGHIKRALDRSPPTHTMSDVYNELIAGKTFLFIAATETKVYGAAVVMFCQYPQLLTCKVTYAGGDAAKLWIKQMVHAIDEIAREVGCAAVESIGRKGWIRMWGAKSYSNALYRRL